MFQLLRLAEKLKTTAKEASSKAKTGIFANTKENAKRQIFVVDVQLQIASLVHTVRRYLKRGWSISSIWSVMGKCLPVSERIMYSYIEDGLVGLVNMDLPLKVKYKPRRKVYDQ